MKRSVPVFAFIFANTLSGNAFAQFRCPGDCPRGNCVKACPQNAPPTCNDYCSDNIRPADDNSLPRHDLTIVIPDATATTEAQVRALLGGKPKD